MGKYMRKSKLSDEVAVMEVSQTLGVRTRAKTLALQRLQSNLSDSDPSCYLQLRSRRLVKALNLKSECNKFNFGGGNCLESSQIKDDPKTSSVVRGTDSVNSGRSSSGPITPIEKESGCSAGRVADKTRVECDLGVEASFGENNLDFEPRERSTRESTPCSLIRDADITTPGSSTRRTTESAADGTSRSALVTNAPSTAEIEAFFARIEQQQQRQFIDKYNFDIANDVPLTGRYEWVRVNN
ncbi:OLC1v1006792C1 [Oldenlandia corymbosa var. corymbosa]|uniref:OLC1v1006792C1 n=1 Tax=Oldenlandia corymbosa var. corymbosa TaxID=529605 RepID=A0AAV1DHU7_OLDCO|nr:OLC1v1006792C1 [Oldenlandia corymbosa var. corymbosa]